MPEQPKAQPPEGKSDAKIEKNMDILTLNSKKSINGHFKVPFYEYEPPITAAIQTINVSQSRSGLKKLIYLFYSFMTTFNQLFYLIYECFCLWVKFSYHFPVTIDKVIIVTAMPFLKQC